MIFFYFFNQLPPINKIPLYQHLKAPKMRRIKGSSKQCREHSKGEKYERSKVKKTNNKRSKQK